MNIDELIVSELRNDPAGIGYAGMEPGQAYEALTGPRKERLRERRLRTIRFQDLLGVLDGTSLRTILLSSCFPLIREMVMSGDRAGLVLFVQGFVASGIMTLEERDRLLALFSEEEETEIERVADEGRPRLMELLAGVPGAPNSIPYDRFLVCWQEAKGR